ncbi:MAG TPA: TetR/AcrR family transcriptional regulator [Pseudonocardiaceae bacterium]|jgi:AcrR family transcriptional regulator|nr:TetR/AcrR family transcriptional regulator [Pseudonocardiaceae bacterium]
MIGRPRSEHAREAILGATLRLVARDGYPAVTIKGIAAAAGVGRQTVYRWWPTKADVVLDAVVDLAARTSQPEPHGEALADVRRTLRATFSQQIAGPAITGLMAEATHDPEFAGKFQRLLLAPRRKVVRDLIVAGQERGQLGSGYDIDLAVDLVFGIMWYRVLSGHAPVDPALADQLTDTLARLLGPGGGDNR